MVAYRFTRRGFTLLEMSLVLVIIGLLVGSIVIGRDLFLSARDRSIIKEVDVYKQGVQAFHSKYDQLPGDMLNPQQYWATPDSNNGWSGNGNGDGIIVWSHEGPEAWRQLELAGFLPGGNIKTNCVTDCVAQAGLNMPRSSTMTTAGWTIGVNNHTGNNVLMYGLYDGFSIATHPVLSAKETNYIDNKIDDGDPLGGDFRARNSQGYNACVNPSNRHVYYYSYDDTVCNFDVTLGL